MFGHQEPRRHQVIGSTGVVRSDYSLWGCDHDGEPQGLIPDVHHRSHRPTGSTLSTSPTRIAVTNAWARFLAPSFW